MDLLLVFHIIYKVGTATKEQHFMFMNLEWQGILFVFLYPFMTELDLPLLFFSLTWHKYASSLHVAERGQQKGLAIAKEGKKKRRRDVKFSHKGKNYIQIKFTAILGSYVFLSTKI